MARLDQVYNLLLQKVNSGVMVPEQAAKLYDQAMSEEAAKSNSGTYQSMASPFGGQGYASAQPGNAPVGQSAAQLGALGNMMSSYADMYGADAAANASMYNSDNSLAGTKYTSDNTLAGSNYGWDAQKNIADIQTLRNLLGIKDTNATTLGVSGNQLAGVKDTNLANQNIATTQGNAQMGTAAINVGPKYSQLDILQGLLAGNTGGLGAGIGVGGQTSGGGTAVDLSGASGTGTGTGAPPVPAFRSFDDIALQRKIGGANADISQQYDTQNKQMTNSLAGRGFSTNSPGFQSLIASNNAKKLGAMQDSNRELGATAMQYNAQNALPYAQAGLGQYNAEADRATRIKLAEMANSNGLLTGLLSV